MHNMSEIATSAKDMLDDFVAQNPIDWEPLVAEARQGYRLLLPATWYGVEFLSVMPPDIPQADLDHLDQLDGLAKQELSRKYDDGRPSGLRLYRPGQRNELGIARSVCIWIGRQAVLDKVGPHHINAATFGDSLYAYYKPNKRNLILDKQGNLEVTEYID
jgi:hypothetical protein